MVDVIPDLPPGTLGFSVSGRLTRDGYVDVLVPPPRDSASTLGPPTRRLAPYGFGAHRTEDA